MKRAVTLFIAVLYLTVSSGLAVEIHHCMGKIEDISLKTSKSGTCSFCGMPKAPNNCCKDELKFVKLQDTHKLLNINYQLGVPEAFLQQHHFLPDGYFTTPVIIVKISHLTPPGDPYSSLGIKHCVFRI